MRKAALLLGLAVVTGGVLAPRVQADGYLRGPDGSVALIAPYGCVQGINASGRVVGESYAGSGGPRATIWDRDGSAHVRGGAGSYGYGLNDLGQAVGALNVELGVYRAKLWDTNGTTIDIGPLPGDYVSWALAIDNHGNVVGGSLNDNGCRAFIWTALGGIIPLDTLAGQPYYPNDWACDINDAGQIAGSAADTNGLRVAVVWDVRGRILRNLGSGYALGINAAGYVAGVDLENNAVVWSPDGSETIVAADARAASISDTGLVLGYRFCSAYGENWMRPFLWRSDTGIVDISLNTAAPYDDGSGGVNAEGWVAYNAGTVWIPEPSAILALLCGLGGLTCRRRR